MKSSFYFQRLLSSIGGIRLSGYHRLGALVVFSVEDTSFRGRVSIRLVALKLGASSALHRDDWLKFWPGLCPPYCRKLRLYSVTYMGRRVRWSALVRPVLAFTNYWTGA